MDVRLEPTRIALVSADPLARAGLRAALAASSELEVVRAAGPEEVAILEEDLLDALLWDDGPAGEGPAPEGLPAATVALVSAPERARAWLAAGACAALARDGDGARIAAALRAAEAGLVTLDPALAAALIGAEEETLTGAPTGLEGLPPLSAREAEVLELVAEGLSNKEIAGALGISPHTAKFHVNALLGKLDAQTRTEAVVRAARVGLLAL